MAYAPELMPYTDAAPCPRVEVFFPEFDPAAATVTVYRSAAGREYPVRGAVRAAVGGSLTRIDFECPLNILVRYRAEMFDEHGVSLGFTDVSELGDILVGLAPGDEVVPADDLLATETVSGTGLVSLKTWLHNPLNPSGAVSVFALESSAREISRPVPVTVSRPLGRRVGVVLSEPRRGVSGLKFDVYAPDVATADRVQALIGDYATTTVPVICVRIGLSDEPMRVPRPMFLGVSDIVERDITVRFGSGATAQEMTGDEVDPPAPGLFVPLLTAADVNAYFATAADVNAYALTAHGINRLYEIAGFAGA